MPCTDDLPAYNRQIHGEIKTGEIPFFVIKAKHKAIFGFKFGRFFFSSRRGILDFYLVIYQEFAIFWGALAKNIWCISNLFMEFCPPNTIKCFPQVYPFLWCYKPPYSFFMSIHFYSYFTFFQLLLQLSNFQVKHDKKNTVTFTKRG